MGLFDFLKLKSRNNINTTKAKDERRAECPSCHKALLKIPGSKTKCPHCGEYIYVRTRPKDNIKVTVNKKVADEIDEEWRIISGTQEIYLDDQKRFNDRKEVLKKKFGGKEPSDNDVYWGLLNEDIINNAVKGQWGLYRNTRMRMADILSKEGKFKQALQTYLEVCYLDLNGASNMMLDQNGNIYSDSELNKPFNVELKFLAPGIIDVVKKIIKKLNLDKQEVKEIYLRISDIEHKSIRAPINPIDTLEELEKEIWS